MKPTLLLINPWIYDFAAYDLWSKPLALLYLASFLPHHGYNIHLIDCLNVYQAQMLELKPSEQPVRRHFGTGKFWREPIPRPVQLRSINRTYSRYGISPEIYIKECQKIKSPLAILVTSHMTYWYPGVQEAISLAKSVFPAVPVILGGTYARLCPEHARMYSGADIVDTEFSLERPESIFTLLSQVGLSTPESEADPQDLPYPAFHLLDRIEYVCLLTSRGCPYRCRYCASQYLHPHFTQRSSHDIIAEILHWHQSFGVNDFAFYDDALLVKSQAHLARVLEELLRLRLNLRFHTPNGLHIREITADMAALLYQSGFRTIRLGFETADFEPHHRLDNKLSQGELEAAIQVLRRAGFQKKDIGAYILLGLPGQTVDSVIKAVQLADKAGAIPYLAEYSPLPHTALWKEALSSSDYDLASEPLFHNNTLLPCWNDEQRAAVPRLKKMVSDLRRQGG